MTYRATTTTMSQQEERDDDLEEYKDRIAEIVEERRDLFDRLA